MLKSTEKNSSSLKTEEPLVRQVRITRLTVVYAILLQLITSIFIILSDNPIRIASLGAFYDLFPNHYFGAGLMLLGVVMAILGLNEKISPYRFLFFLPQFLFLILTSGSALNYVFLGHYADGVTRPWQFIFLDQSPAFLATLTYTFSIFNFRRNGHDS